jgi:hypothetical protein
VNVLFRMTSQRFELLDPRVLQSIVGLSELGNKAFLKLLDAEGDISVLGELPALPPSTHMPELEDEDEFGDPVSVGPMILYKHSEHVVVSTRIFSKEEQT